MRKLIAVIEQTIRKEIEVQDDIPTGEFSVAALNVMNAITANDHSTIISQRFISADVVEVSSDE